jgi:hypothetical protein
MFGGVDAEVGRFDPQRRIVADHGGGTEVGLADRRADDPVVRHARIEPVLDQQMLADVVDLDLQRGGAIARRHGLGQRAAMGDAQLLQGPQRGACRTTDVVGPTLQAVEFLDDRERHDHIGITELEDACRIGDQHRRVDHQPAPLHLPRRLGPVRCLMRRAGRCVSGRKQVGHHHSSADASWTRFGLSYPTDPVCTPAVARRGGWNRSPIPARLTRRMSLHLQ